MILAVVQAALYLAHLGREGLDWLFYFDPRIGIFALLTGSGMSGELSVALTTASEVIRWLSAVWLFLLGIALPSRRWLIKLYVVSETLLSLPTLIFFGIVLISDLSPAHGFSIPELAIPFAVLVIFTGVPLGIGIRAWLSP